jgi:hypothetical protein
VSLWTIVSSQIPIRLVMQSGKCPHHHPTSQSLPENYGFLDTASLFGQFVFEEFHDIHHLLVSLADQLARGSVAES